MTGRNSLRAALLSSCALLFPLDAVSQVTEEAENLGTILLGTKRDVATDTSVAVTTINQEEMDDRQASTIAELIASVPGVTMINGSSPVGGGINIRGFGGGNTYGANQKVMITVDGASQGSEEIYRVGTQLFSDPELFKSVSVIRGTVGSFEYGSGVVGGIVQLETKDASDFTGGEIGYKVRQGLTFGTNGDGITSTTLLAWQPSENVEFLANYIWRRQDPQTDGAGNTIGGPGFKTPSFSLKGKYTFGNNRDQYVSLSYADTQTAERDVPYDAMNGELVVGASSNVDRDIHYKTAVLTYGWKPADNELIDLSVALNYADSKIDNTSVTGSTTALYNTKLRYETTKLTVKNVARFNTGFDHELRAGVEFIRKDRLDASSAPGGTDDRIAFFLIDQLDFGNGFTLTPAMRYETQKLKYKGPTVPVGSTRTSAEDNYDNEALMGGISARYEFQNGFAVFGSAAYTESLPILDDFDTRIATQTWNGVFHNYMTTEEQARTFEIGASYSALDVLSSGDALSLKANIYNTDVWNITSESGLNGVDLKGVELEAAYSREDGIYFEASANIVDYKSRTTAYVWNDYYLQSPTDSLRLVAGKRWDRELDLSWEMVANKGYSDASLTCSGFSSCPVAGFALHNLRATYRPEEGVLAGTEIRLGVENLFDVDYKQRLATREGAGRNIKFGIFKTF